MAEQDQERNEAATPYKLKEAQKRGQTAKSQEATFVAVLAAFVGVVFAAGPSIAQRELTVMQALFTQAGRADWTANGTFDWLLGVVRESLLILGPVLFAVAAAAILVNFIQVGPIFSFKPVTPDWERLNPAAGFKRLFSIRMVYEAFKGLLKLAIVSCVLWFALKHLLPGLLSLTYIDPRGHAQLVMGDVGPLLFKLLMVLLVIAAIDFSYTRWDFAKKMRMSRREITDEHKQREGDPRIRSRLRQLRIEMLKQSRAMQKLPEADVLLTNPTHLAIAISYKHGQMPAPKMLAKGAGEAAAKMREAARRHRIPIVENRPLARELYKRLDSDEYVPEDLYPQVAKILIWVYAMREARAQGAA
ncbi:MAG TPA: flagellar biosynthesis protein FlhB [Paucimonas sp.]|nr:flagellar biosynthesis protein FlhB [Paucimonas sp.]